MQIRYDKEAETCMIQSVDGGSRAVQFTDDISLDFAQVRS